MMKGVHVFWLHGDGRERELYVLFYISKFTFPPPLGVMSLIIHAGTHPMAPFSVNTYLYIAQYIGGESLVQSTGRTSKVLSFLG